MTDNDIVFTVVFTTLIILLLIAGVAITIFIANRQRLQQDMKMAQMQVNYEKELRVVASEVQEQVLVNVSRELHDNIGQLLTVVHIQLEQTKVNMPTLSETLQPVQQTLTDTIQQVRMLGRSLNSDLLEQNGLLNTMQAEIKRLQQLNYITIHWQNDDTEPVLSKDQRLMAFRMFQEMVNNTLKHAVASNMHITLQGGNQFKLTVSDDGKGFDVNQTLQSASGSGLRNIIKRAAMANLTCNLQAIPGKGTIFTLS